MHSTRRSATQIAHLFGVTERTARAWIRGDRPPPPHILAAWQILTGSDLGSIDPAWAGWKLENGELVGRWGIRAAPAELEFLPVLWRYALTEPPAQAELFADHDGRAFLRRAFSRRR